MALQDPVAIFTASSNTRAQLLCHMLMDSGVEAYVTEDFSLVGLWMGGTLPGIHNPKIWVDRADADRAAAILKAQEQREMELKSEPSAGPVATVTDVIGAVCEECGRSIYFPAAQKGSVQNCPHCNAYVDVGEEETTDEWGEDSADKQEEEEQQ